MIYEREKFESRIGSKISKKKFAEVEYVSGNDETFQTDEDFYAFWAKEGFDGVHERYEYLRANEWYYCGRR